MYRKKVFSVGCTYEGKSTAFRYMRRRAVTVHIPGPRPARKRRLTKLASEASAELLASRAWAGDVNSNGGHRWLFRKTDALRDGPCFQNCPQAPTRGRVLACTRTSTYRQGPSSSCTTPPVCLTIVKLRPGTPGGRASLLFCAGNISS